MQTTTGVKIKERPILFSAEMVRAILEGRKTQTRRVLKSEVPDTPFDLKCDAFRNVPQSNCGISDTWTMAQARHCGGWSTEYTWHGRFLKCPYGKPGDRLWVRETFYAFGRWETRFSEKKGRDEWHFVDLTKECGQEYQYPGSMEFEMPKRSAGITPCWWKRPALFMPRSASRILLEITDVRVERLQDISDADAIAEGVQHKCYQNIEGDFFTVDPETEKILGMTIGDYKTGFQSIWQSINGAESWAANPWVWAITFKKI